MITVLELWCVWKLPAELHLPLMFNSRWEGSDLSPSPAAAGLIEQANRKQAPSSLSSSVQITSQAHLKDRERIIL